MKNEDEFDGMLSEALRDVREAEPRVGIEGRVLAGARAKCEERRVRWWKWAVAAAVVIVTALVWSVKDRWQVAEMRLPNTVPHESRSLPQTASTETIREIMKGNGPQAVSIKELRARRPKMSSQVQAASAKAPFPTPVPMTEQEKALMLLARNYPQVLVGVNVEREQKVQRLDIAPIEIEPIEIGGSGEKEQ